MSYNYANVWAACISHALTVFTYKVFTHHHPAMTSPQQYPSLLPHLLAMNDACHQGKPGTKVTPPTTQHESQTSLAISSCSNKDPTSDILSHEHILSLPSAPSI